jgi:Pyridine nucleotide-disulphide oxidoreductase
MASTRKRVLILGGGFAGVYAAQSLEKALGRRDAIEIALVAKENYFVFQPMLAEVISGSIGLLDTVSRHVAFRIAWEKRAVASRPLSGIKHQSGRAKVAAHYPHVAGGRAVAQVGAARVPAVNDDFSGAPFTQADEPFQLRNSLSDSHVHPGFQPCAAASSVATRSARSSSSTARRVSSSTVRAAATRAACVAVVSFITFTSVCTASVAACCSRAVAWFTHSRRAAR